jgi:hypothetical protein
MDHREELLWKYAEGQCTPSELEYIGKNQLNAEFNNELLLIKKLHEGLSQVKVIEAPDDLIALTMNSLAVKSQKIKIAPISYKPLIIFMFFLFVAALSVFLISPAMTFSSPSPWLDILSNYVPNVKLTIPSFPAMGNYVLILLVAPLIAAIDMLFNNNQFQHHLGHKR